MNYCVLHVSYIKLYKLQNTNRSKLKALYIYANFLHLKQTKKKPEHAVFSHDLNLKLTLAALKNSSSRSAFPFPMRAEAMS